MTDAQRTESRPRLVKLVRDRVGGFLGDQAVSYERITDRSEAMAALRAKLVEEAVEYLLDPSVGELADVLDVVMALGLHAHEMSLEELVQASTPKYEERGAFDDLVGMYVQTTAPTNHEGRHA